MHCHLDEQRMSAPGGRHAAGGQLSAATLWGLSHMKRDAWLKATAFLGMAQVLGLTAVLE